MRNSGDYRSISDQTTTNLTISEGRVNWPENELELVPLRMNEDADASLELVPLRTELDLASFRVILVY